MDRIKNEHYNFNRKNITGFIKSQDQLNICQYPQSLSENVGPESWLIFDILDHEKSKVKWMLYPADIWKIDPDYQEFQPYACM